MPQAKKARSSSQQRERVVPVRVIRGQRPPRERETRLQEREPSPGRSKGPQPQDARRMFMWGGVILATIIVFGFWVIFLKVSLGTQSSSDSLLTRIRTEIINFFKNFRPFQPQGDNTNAVDPELEDLRNRVFPEVRAKASDANPPNDNLNAGTSRSETNTSP